MKCCKKRRNGEAYSTIASKLQLDGGGCCGSIDESRNCVIPHMVTINTFIVAIAAVIVPTHVDVVVIDARNVVIKPIVIVVATLCCRYGLPGQGRSRNRERI